MALLLTACAPAPVVLTEESRVTIPGSEASGLVWDADRGTFFVATDEGLIFEMERDGTVVQTLGLPGNNFEGMTQDPSTHLLYAVIEGKDRVLELQRDPLAAGREFTVSRKLDGEKVIHGGKEGFEGIAFVPNAASPEGGTFWVVNQVTADAKKPEPSAMLEIELPLRSEAGNSKKALKGTILRGYVPGSMGLSDIAFDAAHDELLVISDTENLLLRATRSGDIVARASIPGTNQEGVTVDDQGTLYLAEDRHDGIPILQLTPQPSSTTIGL